LGLLLETADGAAEVGMNKFIKLFILELQKKLKNVN